MRRRHLLLGLAFAVAPVSSANAQNSIDFGIQCFVSGFRACASFQATTIYHAALGQTQLLFRISNLQGTPGFQGAFQYPVAGLKEVRVLGMQTEHEPVAGTLPVPALVAVQGNAVANGTVDGGHQDVDQDLFGNRTLSASLQWNLFDSFLFGCDVPSGVAGPSDATCGGFITYSMMLAQHSGRVTLTNQSQAQFGWFGGPIITEQDGTQRFSEIGICTTGTNCVAVTPEPVTLALLGSGLAGIAAARRRRRKSDIES